MYLYGSTENGVIFPKLLALGAQRLIERGSIERPSLFWDKTGRLK